MNNKDKKIIEEQDKLLDHLIEYAGRQYIDEEIKKYEELPELEPSKEFDEKMHKMYGSFPGCADKTAVAVSCLSM